MKNRFVFYVLYVFTIMLICISIIIIVSILSAKLSVLHAATTINQFIPSTKFDETIVAYILIGLVAVSSLIHAIFITTVLFYITFKKNKKEIFETAQTLKNNTINMLSLCILFLPFGYTSVLFEFVLVIVFANIYFKIPLKITGELVENILDYEEIE